MKTIISFCTLLIILLIFNNAFAINIDGYTYLENQTNHGGIKVLFERIAPSSLIDSTFTDSSGYYSKEIEVGIYNITYSKDGYFNEWLFDHGLFSNTTLPDITLLEHTTILNVPSMFLTIQGAMDRAYIGDTVLVDTGRYYENINFNGKSITVASLFLTTQDTSYISQTIIDGNQNGSVVTFENSEDSTAVLTGFTITNGSAYFGGGIYCSNNSSPNIKNFIISGNSASNEGGGIYCNNSDPNLTDVVISENNSEEGGGIYCGNSDPNLTNVTIAENTATYNSGNGGGGILCRWSSPIMINVIIKENISNSNGGGITLQYDSSPILENVIICENNSINNSGGGIFSHESSSSLTNVTISRNIAGYHAGGFFCNHSNPNIINSIVSDNIGDYGIYNNPGYPGNPSISYSDFWNNEGGNFYNCGQWVGVNVTTNVNGDSCDVYYNIQLDPLFVDPDNGDFHLTQNSPCIDAGDPSSPFDPDGTITDMGAYYFYQGIHADFTADITGGESPLIVQFTDLSVPQDSIVSWQWDFGDGDSSDIQNPIHIYQNIGIYTVSLIVTDVNDSTDTETKEDYISVFGITSLSLPEDTTVCPGSSVSIPLTLNNPDEIGIEGIDIVITFDEGVIDATGATLQGGVLEFEDYGFFANPDVDGEISLVFYAISNLFTGSGVIAYLEFDVVGDEGDFTELIFTQAVINDNVVTANDGFLSVVPCDFDISGSIGYFSDGDAVPNVILELTGDSTYSTTTNESGDYFLVDIPGGNYVSTPSKDDDLGGLSGLDASRIARFSVGLYSFDCMQGISSDVSMNGSTSGLDASRVARYAALLITELNTDGIDWVFTPESVPECGDWPPIVYENTRDYTPLESDLTDENFIGIRLGDVSGNWSPGVREPISYESFEITEIETGINSTLRIPVIIDKISAIEGIDICIAFNPEVLQLTGLILDEGILDNKDYAIETNLKETGQGIMVIYAQKDLVSESGIVAFIDFDVIGIEGSSSEIYFTKFDVNETEALGGLQVVLEGKEVTTKRLEVNVVQPIPDKFALYPNYPNPFSTTTLIRYDLPEDTHVNIQIYNIRGQLVKELVNGVESAGRRQIEWNTKGFGSGIYFFKLSTKDKTFIKKMILMR
ncbi:MAG: T9SS type A sorting domain-containing protein [Candidatus Cloacimonetes bacterium]|nr:T9SS type A sorting domain-containing protein [Candidatus Cloacimonadota bacterium]